MQALSICALFICKLFLIIQICGPDWSVQNLALIANTRTRPVGEMVLSENICSSSQPEARDTGTYSLYKNTPPRHTHVKNSSTALWFKNTLSPSKSHYRQTERGNDSHNIRFRHWVSVLKAACSWMQPLSACFMQPIIPLPALSELVSVMIQSTQYIIKMLMPSYYSDSSSDGFQVSLYEAGHMSVRQSEAEFDHQVILVMENDPVVVESATYLFERHPSVSTLMMHHKGTFAVLRGVNQHLTRKSRLVLVGHGNSGSKDVTTLGGHGPEELARAISTIKTENGHLQTISLLSCYLGNDLYFAASLLKALRSIKVETKLHLHNTLLSVHPDGEIVTGDNGIWRYKDQRSLFAELDKSGNLLTSVQLGQRGQVIPDYQGKALYLNSLDWPNHPQMFVPEELRKKYQSIDCLEGLTWSLFFEENERRRGPNYIPADNRMKAIWLTEPETNEENMVFKHITTIMDLLVEIRYNARLEAETDMYYVLNDCIYKVQRITFNVTLTGKFMDPQSHKEITKFILDFNDQKDMSSLHELRQGLKPSKFNDFCRQTFQLHQCAYNCERWGHYFMVAVFSASVRNFRTFSLFLMSVIACEVGRKRGSDSSLCTAFVGEDHPMSTEDPWPAYSKRGFYGCAMERLEVERQDRVVWLDQVVAKENALYSKSKQIMSNVDYDTPTELDIFGRVKVMNKYVFSSYIEYFRGTPEGKKLKRGCVASYNNISKYDRRF